MTWEYLVQFVGKHVDVDLTTINRLGRAGWELVCISEGWAYFKRPQDHPSVVTIGTTGIKHTERLHD